MSKSAVLPFLTCLYLAPAPGQTASVRPEQLRCEYRTNPLGIDVAPPRLSWVLVPMDPKARGLRQTAYRVLAATTEEALRAGNGDLWDSGKVASAQSAQVVYRGNPLASGMRAYWKVQVWDQAGRPSGWSETAFWSMGLLRPEDWKAKWIGSGEDKPYRDPNSPYWNLEKARWIWSPGGDPAGTRFFRLKFALASGAKGVLCTLGADSGYELFVNGHRVGGSAESADVLMPQVFDLGGQVRSGENVIAVRATHARDGKPAGMIGAIRIERGAGTPDVIVTDARWRTSETEAAGWRQPDFDDSRWAMARELGPYGMAPWGQIGFKEERVLPARMLRKEFTISGKLKRATAYVSGLGLFELSVNGHRIGDQVLTPALTDYDKRVLYMTFDVTPELAAGRNAIGLVLGNGRFYAPRLAVPIAMRSFGYPKALLQVELEYANGTKSSVVTDQSWKVTTRGPIRGNNEYDGEEYDANMELPGWDRPGFRDAQWEPAHIVQPPSGALAAQMSEPLRVVETLHPVKVTAIRPGVYIFDMGQNMVGWCRLKVSGPRGARVRLRHAETLREDGTLYVDNLRSARATDFYTLKGAGAEVWEPRFTYHGFRFVEVSGFPGEPTAASLEGRVVQDGMTQTADFSSSNALLNQIHKNIFWGVRGNYRSIPTDCPQRDERQGWLGDRSMVSRSESYLFDIAAFYTKWMTDLADSQRSTGSIPNVAPAYWVIYTDNITWPSTFILLPAMLYEQYGDLRPLERNYPAMKKWIEYMRGFLQDGLMPRDTYGDWCVPPESPKLIHSQDPARKTDGTLISTSYYYHLLRLMARYARLLDKPADASEFDALAVKVDSAFQRKFFNRRSGRYGNGTQTSSILPLAFHMVPAQDRKAVFAGLIRKIEQESKGHIGTGLVGAQWLMRTLSDNGRADVAYEIATQKTYPGWGYMISKGATTIWELWNGDTADPAMNSGNHVMQIGDLGVWMYEYLAGMRSDPEKPGFEHIIIRPYPVGGLSSVKASHKSMYGVIASHWTRGAGRFRLDVTVPANTTATVYVPAKDSSVTESGRPAASAIGVKFLRMDSGAAVYEVGSGTYSFSAAR